jgi:hypothetical protein
LPASTPGTSTSGSGRCVSRSSTGSRGPRTPRSTRRTGPTSRRLLWTGCAPTPAELRRLTALDRAIASSLLADLRAQLDRGWAQLRTAADDRRAAASDRLASDQDRRRAAQDRDNSTRDRGQAALEREQADPRYIVAAQQTATGVDDSLTDRTARSVAESR